MSVVLAILAGCSQRGLVTKSQSLVDSGNLEEALENINRAIDPSDEKAENTVDWPRTWEVRGEVYQAIYQSEDEEINNLAENPLSEALRSYKKALEIDEKGRTTNSVKVKLTLLTNDLTNQAVEAFEDEDYEMALQSFEEILDIQEIDVIKEDNPEAVDTVIIYNAGLAAYNSENYDKAIEYYSEAAEHGYNEAQTYTLIASSYQMKEDTLGALEALKEGFEKYPEDETLLTSMIQMYLDLDETEEAMNYLDVAIERDPNNATFYFAQGTLYEKMGDEENAIEVYDKAIEIDDEFFNAYYNMGALYYNKGVQQIDVANSIPTTDNERYEEELEKADQWFQKALPYMERCYELQPDDNMTKESLKNLYYRMNDMENYNKMREELDQE